MQADDEKHWFVAYVRPGQERVAARMLARLGIECYLPVQNVKRKWSDRIKVIEQLVLPHMIFVHTDEPGRIRSLKEVPQIPRYMFDRATKRSAIVPESQLQAFKAMVEHSSAPVTFVTAQLAPGDTVEIVEGPLKGNVCELVNFNGTKRIAVRIDMLGIALVEMNLDAVRKKS